MLRLCARTRPGYTNAVARAIGTSGQWTPAAPVASFSNAATAAAAQAHDPPAAAAAAAAASSSSSPSVAASGGVPPLFPSSSAALPSGVRVLSVSSSAPVDDGSASADGDPSASSTAALRSLEEQRRPGLQATLQRMRLEFRESIHAKFTQPHKVMEKAYGPIWTGFVRRWRGRIGLLTGAKRQRTPSVHTVGPARTLHLLGRRTQLPPKVTSDRRSSALSSSCLSVSRRGASLCD